ncbi:hypothetical protein RJT34_20099 [Clitoria ternatea]|uniref:Uncharacterized protein n=1 Tax=Clitoria ternatea TaxID=43366 RepID=A0AAN9ISJ5_CLITE
MMDEDFLGLYPLPEPLEHPLRSLTPEYFPLSPREDSNDQDNEDLEEYPLEDLGSNPMDALMADPAILLDLPNQVVLAELMDLVVALAPAPALPAEPINMYIPR